MYGPRAREYRLVLAFENKSAKDAISELVKTMCKDFGSLLPLSMMRVDTVNAAFRSLARSAASIHHYVIQRHKVYPYRLFSLLRDASAMAISTSKSIAEDFLKQPCLMDSFSLWFCQRYPTDVLLRSDAATKELQAVASLATTDIANTECQHAANRRSIKTKSMQTHAQQVADASSYFVFRQLRTMSKVGYQGFKAAPPPNAALVLIKKRGPSKKKKALHSRFRKMIAKGKPLKRGGGAWAIFLSEHASVVPVTEEGKTKFRQLSDSYRALPGQEKERLNKLALLARKSGKAKIVSKVRKAHQSGRSGKRRKLALCDALDSQPHDREGGRGNQAAVDVGNVIAVPGSHQQAVSLLPLHPDPDRFAELMRRAKAERKLK